jgi:hypothetical protein
MMNRHIKFHPHCYLPNHDVSIYVDANLTMRRDPAELIDRYLADGLFAAPIHPTRNCVYDELDACVEAGRVDPEAARAQARRYRALGYPARNGLTENRVLIRRHHEPPVRQLMEAWWQEFIAGVQRDQTCLQVVCWQAGFTVTPMAEDVVCGRYFRYRPHRHTPLLLRAKMYALIAGKSLALYARPASASRERGQLR